MKRARLRPSGSAAPGPRTRPRSRGMLLAGTVALLAVAGFFAARAWREERSGAPRAPVPTTLPDLAGRPAALRDALQRAAARAAGKDTARDGMAELGALCHANGLFAEAASCWAWLRQHEPTSGRWSHLQADARRSLGEAEGLEELLRETVAKAPEHAPAWLRLADHEFKQGRLAEAAGHYRRRLELLPGDAHARLGLARIAQQQGDAAAARRALEELVHDAPDFPPGHNLLADALEAAGETRRALLHRWQGRQAGRFPEAPDVWLEELQSRCLEPSRLFVIGTAEFQLNRGDRGRSALERAVEVAPDNPDAHDLLGDLYLKLGEPGRARPALEKALALFHVRGRSAPVATYVNLSDAWRRLGQPNEALRVADDGLARTGGAFELANARGVTLSALGRQPEAIVAYREGLQRNPNDSDLNFNLAVELLGLGQRQEAVECLQRSLRQQPAFPKSLLLLGRLELDAGRMDAAREHLQLLHEANPGVPEVGRIYARWFARAAGLASERGDLAAVERYCREGLEVAPDDPELASNLGRLLQSLGRSGEAVAAFEAAVRGDPDHAGVRVQLAEALAAAGRREDARRVLQEALAKARESGNAATAVQIETALERI